MYSEYFNYNNCTTGITYYNYSNYCTTAYTNYSNVCTVYHSDAINACSVYHANYTDTCAVVYTNTHANTCSTSHDNSWSTRYANYSNVCTVSYTNTHVNYCATTYTNANNYCSTTYTNTHANTCSTYHNDALNDCLTTQVYANHINYSNPNSGNPLSLPWSTDWSSNGTTLTPVTVTSSVNAIKELRNNINLLGASKSQNTVALTAVPDTIFNDSNTSTHEKIDDTNYNTMVNNLNALITQINPSLGTLATIAEGSKATKAQWEALSQKANSLAAYQSTNYSNTINYTVAAYTNHTNTVNT